MLATSTIIRDLAVDHCSSPSVRKRHRSCSSGTIDVKRKRDILARIEVFERQMELTSAMIENCEGPLYGYGAGLILATYGYHLKTDFAHFVSILDDDKSKHGSSYRNIDVKISHPELVEVPSNQTT